jgi:multicomponent Na+:H+ antiporter subunit E
VDERNRSTAEAASPSSGNAGEETPETSTSLRTVALFAVLALFWYVLSGRIGLQYGIFMVVSVLIVLWLNPERPFRAFDPGRGEGLSGLLRASVRTVRFVVWLVWNVVKANIQVARIILHPRLPIEPQLLVFETRLKSDLAKVLVANSITLTPGTITVDLDERRFLVHSLAPGSAGTVTGAALQNMVGSVFGEAPEPPPEIRSFSHPTELRESGRWDEGGMAG